MGVQRDIERTWLGLISRELPRLENNEVFVNGLEIGIGDPCPAVENGAADKHHINPLHQRASGRAIKNSLLRNPPHMEVLRKKRCLPGSLAAREATVDQLRLHG